MKIYLATNKSNGLTRRYIVMTFARHTSVVRLGHEVVLGATTLERRGVNHWTTVDEDYVADMRDLLDSSLNNQELAMPGVTFRKLDVTERNWLIGGGGKEAFQKLQYDIYAYLYSQKAGKWNELTDTIKMRISGQRASVYIHYHVNNYQTNLDYRVRNYKNERAFFKQLGIHVRQAIKDQDTKELAEYIVEYASDNEIRSSIFHSLTATLSSKYRLDIGVTLTDCDHYGLHNDVLHIGRNGRGRACSLCYDEHVVTCEDEGYDAWRDDLYYHESDGNYYSYEEDEDDGDYDSDDNDQEPNQLMSYSTNVLDILEPDHSIVSSTHGDFRMGIELEMCTRDMSVNSAVRDVRARLGEEYCIVKADGSLPNNGMEIVSAPRGLAEHIKRFTAWDIDSDYRAWNTGKCGMHIHVHSKAFTGLTLGKFLMIVNSDENSVFIRQIAGRHPLHDSQARDYCASEQQEILDNPVHAIKGKYSSRYRMVNCENLTRAERDRLGLTCDIGKSFNTIELRIFKASLKKTRLLAQIEFTHALVMFCRVASWRDLNQSEFKEWHENRDLKQPSFIKWLKSTNNQYPNLCDWYGIRRRPNAKNSAPTALTCADTNSSI